MRFRAASWQASINNRFSTLQPNKTKHSKHSISAHPLELRRDPILQPAGKLQILVSTLSKSTASTQILTRLNSAAISSCSQPGSTFCLQADGERQEREAVGSCNRVQAAAALAAYSTASASGGGNSSAGGPKLTGTRAGL